MTACQLRLEDVVQAYSSGNVSDIEHLLDDKRDLWPGFSMKLVVKSTVGRRLRRWSLRYAQCCAHRRHRRWKRGIAMNLTKRTPEKLSFSAGDKICSHDGHLKVSRGEILLVNLVVQLVQLLAC